jgi:hypothetical protein
MFASGAIRTAEPGAGKRRALGRGQGARRTRPGPGPDYLTSVKGWRILRAALRLLRPAHPRVQPQRPDLVEKAIPPDYALSSRRPRFGLHFDPGDGLPQKYRGGGFWRRKRKVETGRPSTVRGPCSCPSAAAVPTAKPKMSPPISPMRTARRADGRTRHRQDRRASDPR